MRHPDCECIFPPSFGHMHAGYCPAQMLWRRAYEREEQGAREWERKRRSTGGDSLAPVDERAMYDQGPEADSLAPVDERAMYDQGPEQDSLDRRYR